MLICFNCRKVYDSTINIVCPHCGKPSPAGYDFGTSDEFIREHIPVVLEERKKAGLDKLVGGLECVVINTEHSNQSYAIEELLGFTGLAYNDGFEDSNYVTCVLSVENSPDFLIRSRKGEYNPFNPFNTFPKSAVIPNTRLETYVFGTPDLEKYVSIQKSRGIEFSSDLITYTDNYSFIQSVPSPFTGNSIGFIEWKGEKGKYSSHLSRPYEWKCTKPEKAYLKNIGPLDHAAVRVKAEERNAAIIEFMIYTNYLFDFAIYVKSLNSITSVTRLTPDDFALVFTSGKFSYVSDEVSGPTEKFIQNYGTRTHHVAFRTEHIDEVYQAIIDDGMKFLVDLIGSPEEGLKQAFTVASENTLLVNEYIRRYEGFDGFFTKSNVTELTRGTEKQ